MSKQTRSTATNDTTSPVQAVQTAVETGNWMFLNEATDATGLSEKTLRRYIKKRQVKSRRLGKQINSPLQVWITPDILKEEVETEELDGIADVLDSEELDDDDEEQNGSISDQSLRSSPSNEQIGIELDRVLKTITQQFADKLDEQKEAILILRTELHEKQIQLRLLPDLQKELEEKEKLADFQTNALVKQIEELKLENERLRQESEANQVKQETKKSWWKWLTSSSEK
jgi:hypothetical protein